MSPERLYTLLEVANEVRKSLHDAHLTIARLTAENLKLEREIGKARLLSDMRQQLHEFRLSADAPMDQPNAFFRRQI